MTVTSKQNIAKIFNAIPIFRVSNLQNSIDFYTNVMGFKQNWIVDGGFASVSRDQCNIFLCEGDQGNPGTWIWIGVEDIEPLYEELKLKGAKIRMPPTNYPWSYEVHIEDIDGNVLRFGSDNKDDEPIGDWLDMYGQRWTSVADGKWQRS